MQDALSRHDAGMDQVRVVVDNRIRVRCSDLPAEAIIALKKEFDHWNPARAKLEAMGVRGYALHKEPKFISSWKLEGDEFSIPRGGIGRLRGVFEEFGIPRKVIDARTDGTGPRGIPEHRITLRPFQQDLVDKVITQQNCVVRSPTGSGKSTAALGLASAVGLPTLVIVWTGGLMDQWVRRVESELGLHGDEIGIIGGGKHRIRSVTIGMQQSLVKCADELSDTFGMVIADELQRFSSSTFFAVIDKFKSKYRVGLSADEHRKDKKEFLIYDLFGDVAVDVDQDSLIDGGYVHDVEVRVIPTDFDAPWYHELFGEDYRNRNIPQVLYEARMRAFDRISNEMMVDPARGQLAVQIADDEIKAGHQVVLLSHRREWCRRLDADLSAKGIRCGQMLGGIDSKEEYDRTLHSLLDGSLRAAAGTYQAIGQGIDIPSVSVGICCSPLANSADGKPFWSQVRGRLCRTSAGKQGARLYYLLDWNVYGSKPLKNLMRWNNRVVIRDGAAWIDAKDWLKGRTP